MGGIVPVLEAAAKVGNQYSLAAFAIAALLGIAWSMLRKKTALKNAGRIIVMVIVAIVIMGALPLVARTYLQTHTVYRLRVTVEDPSGVPLDDARLTSSLGGEAKKVQGGWEFDIPSVSRPADGKMRIYGEVRSAFLAGRTEVLLANEYDIPVTLRLDRDRSAHIRGRVIDKHQNPLVGVLVSVAGYESEAQVTGALGQFDLFAHAADGEPVQVDAFKKGLGTTSEWIQAGDQPATIILERN